MLTGSRRLILAIAICSVGCGNHATDSATATTTTGGGKPAASDVHTGKLTKLTFKDVKVGDGEPAVAGDQLTMKYTGRLANGTVFDSNDTADGKPFTFVLGAGSVIAGWDQGLVGIKEGGERRLSIPAALGYGGKSPSPKIPPNSDLYFDVKLDTLMRMADRDVVTVRDIKKGSGPATANGDSVTIHWTASVPGGEPFDSSDIRGGKPMTFVLGGDTVFKAVSKGMEGMQKGGERILKIPTELGPHGPQITPGTPTVWDITLLSVRKK